MKRILTAAIFSAAFAAYCFAQTPITFSAPTLSPSGYQFVFVQASDINNDGKMDIVGARADGGAIVLLGNGDGTFEKPKLTNVQAGGLFRIADLNGDGIADIVGFGSATYGGTYSLNIYLGVGDGTFVKSQTIKVSSNTTQATPTLVGNPILNDIRIADVSGDGIPDVVSTSTGNAKVPNSFYGVTISPGVGDGTFGKSYTIPVSAGSIAIGDYNGDAIADIVATRHVELLGKGAGSFALNEVNTGGGFLFPVDVNGDGNLDMATISGSSTLLGVSVLFGNGDGTFQAPVTTPVPGRPLGGDIADFNGDGIPDAVVYMGAPSHNQLNFVLNNSSGSGIVQPLVLPVAGSGPDVIGVISADFNGDGKLDVAYIYYPMDNNAAPMVGVLLNTTP